MGKKYILSRLIIACIIIALSSVHYIVFLLALVCAILYFSLFIESAPILMIVLFGMGVTPVYVLIAGLSMVLCISIVELFKERLIVYK